MARIPHAIEARIQRYLLDLAENNIRIRRAYVFGSYARGTYDEWSDIDIALVSDGFDGDRIADKNKIRRITLRAGSDIEPLPFTLDEFNESNPLVKEILTHGIEIPT
ncbi:MAG TPA: nucleotidyltransferase domain-containing protein [Spirochaetota bacterium]|nr:nucleotidyltransferase domain-containing protein [Spirochaetota bacterium]HNT12463.1 nucleotidyltransferase domain-containing protein [Spirochaetota bacterium]HNV45845.1 nucleotidyltransferase domain-containing protein [Spirochaetota bacterium]HOS39076.1 nucleotidyltransferase domain-containing protein [Spirochaetota bacterium]HPU87411.1 nucleotidyltransferase domain-containing protein [Spirochaetota bacterium]